MPSQFCKAAECRHSFVFQQAQRNHVENFGVNMWCSHWLIFEMENWDSDCRSCRRGASNLEGKSEGEIAVGALSRRSLPAG